MKGIRSLSFLAAPVVTAALVAPALAAGVSVGDKAPAWELSDWVNSRPYKLPQLGGKAVMLEFWASW
jgi:hypothetical protein